MIVFKPSGAIQTFTSAASAPTSVQATTQNNVADQQYCLTNIDQANDAWVGWGPSDTVAKANAIVAGGSPNIYYLLARSQIIISAKADSFFTGITVAGGATTAIVKVQPGYGA